MLSRAHAVAGALLVALAAPASAQAVPTIEPLRPCYATAGTQKKPVGEGVVVRAQGFTPNSKVDLTLNGEFLGGSQGLQVNEAGLLTLDKFEFPAPFARKGAPQDFEVRVAEQGNPANVAVAVARTVRLDVAMRPRSARPSSKVRFKGSGFLEEGRPVFAHYLYRGKPRRTVRLAEATGPCGTWTARAPQIPVRNPSLGRWRVQFDQSKRYVNPRKRPEAVDYWFAMLIDVVLDRRG
jgi:hypothetical protein